MTDREIAYSRDASKPVGLCPMCGVAASPCDCERTVWTYEYRMKLIDSTGIVRSQYGTLFKRHEAIELRARDERLGDVDTGPIQRITDPPYQFDTPAAPTASPGPVVPTVPRPRQVVKRSCALDWCDRATTVDRKYCSDHCKAAADHVHAANARLDSFVNRVSSKQEIASELIRTAMDDEVAWAKDRTSNEVEAIRRRWSSMRPWET